MTTIKVVDPDAAPTSSALGPTSERTRSPRPGLRSVSGKSVRERSPSGPSAVCRMVLLLHVDGVAAGGR